MDENKNSAKISPSGMRQTLGIDTTRYADKSRRASDLPLYLDRYGRFESRRLLSTIATPQPNHRTVDLSSASGIISYLQPKHLESGRKTAKLKRLRAMAPEIQQAQVLVASSIMSPNDLQEGDFTFAFPNVDAIEADSDMHEKLSKLYDDYFNKNLDMGSKCYEWICESMYTSGAKAVLILPPGLQQKIASRTKEDLKKDMIASRMPIAAVESFDHYISHMSSQDNFMLSHRPTTWASVLGTDDIANDIRSIVPSMEQLDLRIPEKYAREQALDLSKFNISDGEYTSGLEDMVVNMRTKLAKGDMIRISENPEIVRFNLRRSLEAKNRINAALDNRYANKEYVTESVISLDEANIPLLEHSRPALIELPTESVIPIFIPGSPSEHLGYFIIIDEEGQPLAYDDATNPDPNKLFSGNWAGDDTTSEAFSATYGTSSNVLRVFEGTKAATETGNAIFNHFLDKFIRQHLKGLVPDESIEIGRFNSIATSMFYRLLANKRTTLVYAPPRLLHYLAFDYREDGTGMPKPENIEFILSLRTTLMISNILAQANDAINHKKIEFDGGENIKNIEQIMDLIKRVFITKNKISGSVDPSEIMDDIASNAITIVPKNFPGLGGNFNVDIQSTGTQSVRADDNLLENLSNLLISNLDVPPSALNQLSEPEFSRSLVTYNLFFAKKINLYQKITCRFMTELIRDFTRYDTVFQKALSLRLNAISKKPLKQRMPKSVAKMAQNNKNTYSSISSMTRACLEGVAVTLPKSNIVADKTLYEEVRNYVSNLEEISQQLFSAERVPSSDQEASDALTLVRARWKYDQLKTYLSRIGKMSMVDIPDMDDLAAAEDYTDYIQTLRNINAAVVKHGSAMAAAGEEEGGFGGGGGSFDSSGGGSSGGDDSSEDGDDEFNF